MSIGDYFLPDLKLSEEKFLRLGTLWQSKISSLAEMPQGAADEPADKRIAAVKEEVQNDEPVSA